MQTTNTKRSGHPNFILKDRTENVTYRTSKFMAAEMVTPRRHQNVPRLDKCSANQSNKWSDQYEM